MSLTQEIIEMENEYRHLESNQARLSGRWKFACCRRCSSIDGMQKVHRDTLIVMSTDQVAAVTWYSELGNDDEYLFIPCCHCNSDKIIPDIFEVLNTEDVLYWLENDDPGI